MTNKKPPVIIYPIDQRPTPETIEAIEKLPLYPSAKALLLYYCKTKNGYTPAANEIAKAIKFSRMQVFKARDTLIRAGYVIDGRGWLMIDISAIEKAAIE